MYHPHLKRFLDLFFSLMGILVASPVLFLLSIFFYVSNNGKIFFIQERPGKDERIFKVIKFKTMNDKKDAEGNLLPDNKRITKIGALARKLSLDEIPQLFNVLKGDMSFIGPRPLLVQYLPLYSPEQKRRHHIRPGITGWAQVNGRNAIGWPEKFKYDIYYVDHLTAALDLKIILLTIKKVFARDGINNDGETTMPYFTGNS